ncbi:type VI secretion system Vgr family protein [Escherichia coli P0302308.13]|nr:type VI secretion system Vgr family protein [Escherichia coli P0302308.13]
MYDYPGRFKGAHGQNFARWQMEVANKQKRAEQAVRRRYGRDGELC